MDLEKEVGSWTDQHDVGGRDVFKKAYSWDLYEQLSQSDMYPYFQELEENQGPVARYRGREVLMLGSNNYLGLTTHPRVREKAIEAIKRFGTGMTGSRFLNGTVTLHHELEAKLAAFLGKPAALVFTTGYQANLGLMTALVNKTSVAVIDRFSHASIHDGTRLMEGEVKKFPHNDLKALDQILSDLSPETGALICVDGVYSMEGDLADVPEILKIAKKHKTRFAIDDAHGLGVMGPGGRGTAHHFGLEKEVDLIVGTFSKSLASIGGFVAGEKRVVDFVKHFGRPMLFSASLTPSCTAAAMEALQILIEEPERAEQVRKNAAWMKKELTSIGYKTGEAAGAIVPIVIGDTLKTFAIWKMLLDEGVYTNPVPYPAVAKGQEMLRTSYLATQTQDQLVRALEIFKKVGKSFGI